MKVIIEEKLKHRLVGIAVIVSVAVVFAPAALKKSQERFEETVSISVKLPAKPPLPKVTNREANDLFNKTKVAAVEVPTVQAGAFPAPTISQAEPLSPVYVSQRSISQATIQMDAQREGVNPSVVPSNASNFAKTAALEAQSLAKPPKASAIKAASSATKPKSHLPQTKQATQQARAKMGLNEKAQYGVQLATFAVQENAIALVNRLKNNGYPASYAQTPGKNGQVYYKVIVGAASEREEALRLQKKLVQTLQINGFIVNQGVS